MIFRIGRNDLEMVSLDRVHRELVYDPSNTDALYMKWIVAATCVYSPGGWPIATATRGGPQGPVPRGRSYSGRGPGKVPGDLRDDQEVAGDMAEVEEEEPPAGELTSPFPLAPQNLNPAFITDAQLRVELSRERQQVKIGWPPTGASKNAETGWWVVSHADGRRCDVANGPFVLALDVVQVEGAGRTFGVGIQVQFHTPVTPKDLLVLSHRWEMTHVHDENHYLTRLVDGVVIFNGAELDWTGVAPDWLRNQFFHPIPLGFRRYLDPVTASADGLTIRYRIRDVDQSVTFDAGDSGATLMDIQESVEYVVPWGYTGVADNGPGFAKALGKAVRGSRTIFDRLNPFS